MNDSSALKTFLGPIADFLAREDLTEICINRPHEVWCEGSDGWSKHDVDDNRLSSDGLLGLARLAATFTSQEISPTNPVLSTTLPGGERCQIVIPPAVPEETVSVTIRKPSDVTMNLADFEKAGMFNNVIINKNELTEDDATLIAMHRNQEWIQFFDLAVRARKNIIISGATGSGKTTFSKSLIQHIPAYERILTIEDALELDIPQENHVRLLYSKGGQGRSEAGPKELLESCLRMRPDRILLQELRDGTAFFYLRNANSGHPGSITTVHADSAALAFEQLTLLVKESDGGAEIDRADIRILLMMLIDIVVQLKKFPDGSRRMTEVYFDPRKQLENSM